MRKGFSLIELLIAVAILAIVVAIIVPKFLNVQQQATDAVAQQMASQLNSTYANWQSNGGTISGSVMTSDLLKVLGSSAGVPQTINGTDVNGTPSIVSDNNSDSQNIRVTVPLPAGVTIGSIPSGSVVTLAGGIMVAFDNSTQQFSAGPVVDLSSLQACHYFTNQRILVGQPGPAVGIPQYIYGVASSQSSYSGPQWYSMTWTLFGTTVQNGQTYNIYQAYYQVQYSPRTIFAAI